MYRFIRTVTVRHNAALPSALKFASEVTAHIKKHYDIAMMFGAELYGSPKVHWHFDIDSLDKMQQLNAKLMVDREYLGLLDKFKENWVEGSMKDTLVSLQS